MLQDILKSQLLKQDNVLFAYLFGSYALGKETSKSDVDIALYLQDTSLDNQLQITYELSRIMDKDVDIVFLNDTKSIYLLESIFKDGIILKDSEYRIEFELVKQHDILDYKAFKRYIDAA